MKKKAVYIHGLGGSGEGSSSKNIRKFLADEYDLSSSTYDLLQPQEAFTKIKKDAEEADLVIASSLGGFYASCLNVKGKVLLLNPCLLPQKVIKEILASMNLSFENEDLCVREWNELQKLWYEKSFDNYAGIFADNDELFHFKNVFDENMKSACGENSAMISGTHQIAKDDKQLKDALEAAEKIFSKLK